MSDNSAESKYERIDLDFVIGVYDTIDKQRRFVSQLVLTLDIVVMTFTPPVLITGLSKLEGHCARPWFYGLGIAGLSLAVASLAMGLLYFGWTRKALRGFPHYYFGVKKKMLERGEYEIPKTDMGSVVERNKVQWKLATVFSWFEVGSFVSSVLLIIASVFILLASIY